LSDNVEDFTRKILDLPVIFRRASRTSGKAPRSPGEQLDVKDDCLGLLDGSALF
jgi:hypothetical protein